MNKQKALEMTKTLIGQVMDLSHEEADYGKMTLKLYAALDNLNKVLEKMGVKDGCDVIDRNEYIASKLWCREDVKGVLLELEYSGT